VIATRLLCLSRAYAEGARGLRALGPVASNSAVVRTNGSYACVVEITEVRVAPCHQVDGTFHIDEGEGDASREAWIAGHHRYWTSHAVPTIRRVDPSFRLTSTTPVVFERFRTIAAGDRA
jgi:uncharacterized protein YhfF